MRKIPKKYAPIVQFVLTVAVMGLLMSGLITYLHIGFSEEFISVWLHAFASVYFIALGAGLIVRPAIEKLLAPFVEK